MTAFDSQHEDEPRQATHALTRTPSHPERRSRLAGNFPTGHWCQRQKGRSFCEKAAHSRKRMMKCTAHTECLVQIGFTTKKMTACKQARVTGSWRSGGEKTLSGGTNIRLRREENNSFFSQDEIKETMERRDL